MADKELITDMWYGNKMADADNVDGYWSDCDCVYRGNFYRSGEPIGDYTAKSLQAIEGAWKRTHKAE